MWPQEHTLKKVVTVTQSLFSFALNGRHSHIYLSNPTVLHRPQEVFFYWKVNKI